MTPGSTVMPLSAWRGPAGNGSRAAPIHSEPAHPPVKIGPVGAQPARGFGHVPSRGREGAGDQHTLVAIEGVAQRELRSVAAVGMFRGGGSMVLRSRPVVAGV